MFHIVHNTVGKHREERAQYDELVLSTEFSCTLYCVNGASNRCFVFLFLFLNTQLARAIRARFFYIV